MAGDGWDVIGSVIGGVLGTAVGGPVGAVLGTAAGGYFGSWALDDAPAPQHSASPKPPPYPGSTPEVPPYPGLPAPPGANVPGSGGAADAAGAGAKSLAQIIDDLAQLDRSAAATLEAIHAAGVAGQKQLDTIARDVNDKITELGPRLNTAAGQQELRDFLTGKLTSAKKVIDQQIADAEDKARRTRELTERYAGIGGDDSGKPGAGRPAGHGGGSGGGDGSSGSGGGSGSGGDQGTTPASAPAASPGTPPFGQGMMPGAGMMPAGMGMPSIPSLGGGGIPGLGGGDPLGALGGLGGGHGAGFHDDGSLGGDSSKAGDSGLKFRDDDGSSGSGAGKPGPDAAGTSSAAAGGSAGSGSGPGTELAGDHSGHAGDPGAGQVPAATTSVSLPDGETSEARTAQGAAATKAVLGGATVADAWHQAAGVTLPPPGTPVMDPIPPTRLKAGDVGIWQDHLVMALGNGKVWVSGQPQPLSSVGSGPDFLGWMDPSALAPKGVEPAAAPPPPTPPTPPS